MTLAAGSRLGTYDITGSLGAGGMGEVYLARDPSLNRDVAIKVLPAALSGDPERAARLRREAQVLAALNHPHIAAIYALGDSGSTPFLVLELVEGETLAELILRSRPPLDETLRIARQIADAMEAAHDKGIIHRDLKPANIKITRDGTVKVLDFGLAKMLDVWGGLPESSEPQTIMATSPGMVIGTAPYMAPEQANGREADRASDVWAFGCVLYEMLARRRAFEGQTISEILANVLKEEPNWERLPGDTPDGIRRLLRRTLQKDPTRRFRDIRDARLQIDEALSGTPATERVAPSRFAARERVAWVSGLAVVALVAVLLGIRAFRPLPAAPELRLELNTPPSSDSSVAVSPDGLKVLFIARAAGPPQLWLRSLDSPAAQPLPATEHAINPFWSPDSRSIGFFADTRLRRMDIDGGSMVTLASDAAVGLGGSWGSDGTILFAKDPGSAIFRVPAAGGDAVAVTRLGPQQRGHSFPRFLPDGRHFLFFVDGTADVRGVYVGEIDRWDHRRLLDAASPAEYGAGGQLLFVRDKRLMAQTFDSVRLEVAGDAYAIAEGLSGRTEVSASPTGTIAYRTSSQGSGLRQLVWVDRAGREISKEVYPDGSAMGPALSHDGRHVAVYRFANGNMDIWSYQISRRAWDRVTFDPGDDIYPLWSRDDASMVFGSARESGVVGLYRKRLHAANEPDELLLLTPLAAFPMDWSADGRLVLYTSLDSRTGFDIWALPLDGNRRPFAVVQTEFNEGLAQFSPDGKWLAYQTDKTGRFEIYVRPFPGPGGDVRISTDGGTQPRWNPNGTEMFYVAPDDKLMAVPLRIFAGEPGVEPGTPVALFATIGGNTSIPKYRQQYAVSADGRSFVMHAVVGDTTASPISIILNWKPVQR